MKCITCGEGSAQGISLFRQNAKGQPGVWACEQHDKARDDELWNIVAALESEVNEPPESLQ